MLEIRTTRNSRRPLIAAALGTAVLAASPAFAQKSASEQAGHATTPPVVHLCSPRGSASTLTFAGAEGWLWRDGWDAGANAVRCEQPKSAAVLSPISSSRRDARPVTEKPLTVFIDGPTGYAFVYLAEEGWKFAGKVADRRSR